MDTNLRVGIDSDLGDVSSDRKRFLTLEFEDISTTVLAQRLVVCALRHVRRNVFFVNAHCFNQAWQDRDYKQVLKTHEPLYADGVGMAMAARICGKRLMHNVNGTDLLPEICRYSAEHGVSLALLGAKPGIAQRCADNLCARWPGLRIVFTAHGYLDADGESQAITDLRQSGARILLVAKGVPAQEMWIQQHGDAVNVPVILGVGALFDFYSGAVRRAPTLFRRLRLEWLYRLMREPHRLFLRYVVGNPLFLTRVWRARRGDEH